MAIANIANATGFGKHIITKFNAGCVTSVLDNPDNAYDINFGEVKIPYAEAGGAANYTEDGFVSKAGGSDTLDQQTYKTTIDRYKPIRVPYEKEMSIIQAGGESPFMKLIDDFIGRVLPAEIDAVTTSRIHNKAGNKMTGSDVDLTKDGIFNTLDELDDIAYNNGVGVNVPIYTFVNREVYNAIKAYMRENHGFANGAMLRNGTRRIKTNNEALDSGEGVRVECNLVEYGHQIIIPIPANRAYTDITLFDGLSEGQTDGGWVPSEGAKKVQILSVPATSAFLGIQFFINNLHIPFVGAPNSEFRVGLDNTGVNTLLHNVIFKNDGVNQIGTDYLANMRIRYDADVMPLKSGAIVSVTE